MTPSSPYPDIGAQAELLAYLVLSQLLMRHLTGRWLTAEHVVESTHLWLLSNGGGVDWLQRISLGSRAQDLAEDVAQIEGITFDAKTLGAAFLGYQHLNHRSPAVAAIYRACVAFVIERHTTGSRARSDK
jgi:hypothetical protein